MFLLISFLVGIIESAVAEKNLIYNIIEIIYLLISIPLSFGLLISFIKLKRNEKVGVFDFFKEGFSRFGKAWGICLYTLWKMLLPIVCLILLIFVISALMIVSSLTELSLLLKILYIAILLTTVVYVASRALLYVIAYNISYDNPELSSKECVKQSEALMKGNRGNYFLLELSFIGWILLIIALVFIGSFIIAPYILISYLFAVILLLYAFIVIFLGEILLMPYMQVSAICFYEKVANKEIKDTEKTDKIEE